MQAKPFADVYYGSEKSILNSVFGIEVTMLFKNDVSHSMTEIAPNVLGLPQHTRFIARADIVQLNCTERKVQVVKMEYYRLRKQFAFNGTVTSASDPRRATGLNICGAG